MQTIDTHVHLLNSEVKFNRLYDKIAIRLFGRKLGFDPKVLLANPYSAYTNALVKMIRNSQYLTKIVLFGVDAQVDDSGKELHRDPTVCATNEALLKLYQENSDVIIPFFSINPMRPNAVELIDKYYGLGFKGAKFLQNYWGVDTREERYLPYFEKLKALNIPLIIHLGSESSVSTVKACENITMLEQPLAVGVKVIAAHMALSYKPLKFWQAFSKKPKNFNKDYFTLLKMLGNHDNLYADISALLTPVRAKVLRHLSEQTHIHDKLLFATDYPVPFSTVFTSYDLPYKKRFALAREANPFDRCIKAMLEYFPEDNPIYTNHKKILEE